MKRFVNISPSLAWRIALGLVPLLLALLIYSMASQARLAENANDKLLPSFAQMSSAWQTLALEPSRRTGDYPFWVDTKASLKRLALGVLIAAGIGLVVGVLTGAFPLLSASISPLLTVVSLVPPLAILPVLFIIFGLGEFSKVALIALGIAPFIARDLQKRTQDIPFEQLVKGQTLGANSAQLVCFVLLPQILPRLLDAVRLSLGAGWLFLIASEAIASTDGLGYRIFLVRRYMSMDIILPYVAWITLLAFLFDIALRWVTRVCFPWYAHGGRS